jgi:hypothetical protein
MATLAEIRARLQAMENKGGNSSGSDGAIYPFWNLSEGSSSLIRFLPDGNPDNTFFWAQREMIRLPFAGVKGGDSKPVVVQVPCVEMFGRKDCPVLTQVRPMFKDPTLETIARKYWKKRSYVFQGFVVEDGVKEENAPENPIRRFIIGPQLYQIIQASLMDPELEEVPTHYDLGIDFRVAKTKKGEYSDYSTSKWSRRERALTSEERDAIDTHGLLDLTEFLPKEPNEQELQAIGEMFEASFGGEAYDPERWGNFYKPYGLDTGSTTPAASAPAQASKPAPAAPAASDDEDDTPFDNSTKSAASAPAAPGGAKAEDILAMIRSRKGS